MNIFLQNFLSQVIAQVFPLFQLTQLLLFPGCVFYDVLRLNLSHPAVRKCWIWWKFSEDLGSCVAKKNRTYLLFSSVHSSEITYLLRKKTTSIVSRDLNRPSLIWVDVESEVGVKRRNKVVVWPQERPIWLSCDCVSCLKRFDEK